MRRFNFGSALLASIIATILMTAFMMYFGMDVMLMLGKLAGMDNIIAAYLVGGAIHFIIGLLYGLLYALIFEPLLQKLPGFLSGTLYSLIPFILALTLMGQFTQYMQKLFGSDGKQSVHSRDMDSPPSPYSKDSSQYIPYSPDDQDSSDDQFNDYEDNQCAPNQPSNDSYQTSFLVCIKGDHFDLIKQDTYHPKASSQNGSMQPYSGENKNASQNNALYEMKKEKKVSKFPTWVWSLFNHLIYGFFLGLVYRPRKISQDKE